VTKIPRSGKPKATICEQVWLNRKTGILKLSTRIQNIEGSKTARFIPLLEQMRQAGRSVISLAIGEPAADTPPAVIDATVKALQQQKTRYSEMAGIKALRDALAGRFENCEPENIVVFNGSKQALYAAFQALCNPGIR
jgi:aspartate aminotransferase